MKVLVCGGRDYADVDRVKQALDETHAKRPITWLVHGGARGADTIAGKWALLRGIPTSEHFADWAKHGRAAGPIRNQQMLDAEKPDLVIAFPGGRGTANMVRLAKQAGVEVLEIA